MIPAQRHAPIISALGREQEQQCKVLFVLQSESRASLTQRTSYLKELGQQRQKGEQGERSASQPCFCWACVCAYVRTGRQVLVEIKGKMQVLFLWCAVGFVWLFSDMGFSPSAGLPDQGAAEICLSLPLQNGDCKHRPSTCKANTNRFGSPSPPPTPLSTFLRCNFLCSNRFSLLLFPLCSSSS